MGQPDEQAEAEGPFLPRWVLLLMIPGIAMPLLIFLFILSSESAHDEADCPYVLVVERPVAADVKVIEERRRCLPEVEDRRYSLVRGDQRTVMGRRRFRPPAFEQGYRWTAKLSELGEVQVEIHNEGHDDVLFREGTKEEHEKGISY